MATMAPRAIRVEDGLLRSFGERLLSATSLVQPSSNSPFERFGVLAAGAVAARPRAARETRFSVAEARSRIGDFSDGSYKPRSLSEFMGYLAERLLRLESRRQIDGRSANYLVDEVSKRSVPAAAVDSRLSRAGLARMFGRTLDAEAEVRRRKLETSPEMIEANHLKILTASRFRKETRSVPFTDWEDLRFSAPAMFKGREVMAQGNELWLGQEIARASEDPAKNLEFMAKMRAEGRRILIPAKTAEDAKAGRFVIGMPILLRDGAVRTRLIDPRLGMASLSRLFGETPYEHFKGMADRAGIREEGGPDKVVKLSDFRQFRRRPDAPAVAAQSEPAAARAGSNVRLGDTARFVVRHDLDQPGTERLKVIDSADGSEKDLSDTELSAGRYVKQDAFGIPVGYLVVDSAGGYAHQDQEGRFHNPYGPAIVPEEGSGQKPRFAIEGEFMSEREFSGRHAPTRSGASTDGSPGRRHPAFARRQEESARRQSQEEGRRNPNEDERTERSAGMRV